MFSMKDEIGFESMNFELKIEHMISSVAHCSNFIDFEGFFHEMAMETTESYSNSWANAMPKAVGLYNPDLEKDSCGVGFIVDYTGKPSNKILRDASQILCNMTHRGAVGADARDGDGAGVMTAMPDKLFRKYAIEFHNIELPAPEILELNGNNVSIEQKYATGNVFLPPDPLDRKDSKAIFEKLASNYQLKVLFWRTCPVDSSRLGPVAAQKQPAIEQPFIVLDNPKFASKEFQLRLFLLRKFSSNSQQLKPWFYICSLNCTTIVYKGLLVPKELYSFYLDLSEDLYETHFALVHSRYSTNTFPSWDRAQPLRTVAHNGEINTLKGNRNWMKAREGVLKSSNLILQQHLETLFPIIEENGSDSSSFDNVLEMLVLEGKLSLPEAVLIMIPEAWQKNPLMSRENRAFYEWASCVLEPWDGPALITFSDGRYIGACLDRNGLRPCRYYITKDNILICASEVGTVDIDAASIISKRRLKPGKILLADCIKGKIMDDEEIKNSITSRYPFIDWTQKIVTLSTVQEKFELPSVDYTPIARDPRLIAFKYSLEDINMIIEPMCKSGKEPLGSMGNDSQLACLKSDGALISDFFKQLFAQVTNPPIDPIREEIIMSLETYIGPEGNLLSIDSHQCKRLKLGSPILSPQEFETIKNLNKFYQDWKVGLIDITVPKQDGIQGYVDNLDAICEKALKLIDENYKICILSDRNVNENQVAISSIICLGALHQYLITRKKRTKIAIVVESGEIRSVHDMCILLGFGADAIYPYLVMEILCKVSKENIGAIEPSDYISNYKQASENGILKVMSKMGISTLQSYKGAQIFEIIGMSPEIVQKCFSGTSSRIKGVDFSTVASQAFQLHELAFPSPDNLSYKNSLKFDSLPDYGQYHWKSGGEYHMNTPQTISSLQNAVKLKDRSLYDQYSKECWEQSKKCTLRGMLEFKYNSAKSIPIDEVEPWTNIVRRFCTGAMSYGSISYEAHSTLALAMNKLGGKSNTGEGGEDLENRSRQGNPLRSAIKQIASGRFGVNSYYLCDADEIQIKMAQGAKPGEGGELPGYKVSLEISKTRKSTEGVGLISPPPHHDIYSIEDLKQLIYDLKCCNPHARISVKLVSEIGVGVIASGVAKASADHILISGHDGGTGASRWTGIKHAGLPWELGLAETHQTLVMNDLRTRVVLQTDGQLKTGRDVAISCLLGAEEWGFATTPLIAMGCIMMRKCHLNSCPVGIATQDPVLREKFKGQPENVINFFYFVAEEMRSIMASLGMRSVNEMVGRSDLLIVNDDIKNRRSYDIDLTPLLVAAHTIRSGVGVFKQISNQICFDDRKIDNFVISEMENGFKGSQVFDFCIKNTDRSVGTTISYVISSRYGEKGLPDCDKIVLNLKGSAGQSFGAFLQKGITLKIEGDCNDYVGKGLSGGKIIVIPPENSNPLFIPHENVIVGNVCLYGATAGECYVNGIASERFCVRNSGAVAVCEGLGDHGCEYMTGGFTVILGSIGRNFGAGMSGGLAYIYNYKNYSLQALKDSCINAEMIDVFEWTHNEEQNEQLEFPVINKLLRRAEANFVLSLKYLIECHYLETKSKIAEEILTNWNTEKKKFIKIYPKEFKKIVRKKMNESIMQQSSTEIQSVLVTNEFHKFEAMKDIEDTVPSKKFKGGGDFPFLKNTRRGDNYRDPSTRIKDFNEISDRLGDSELQVQATRCMDCGVPFCQSNSTGCPIGNIIPKWNELVRKNYWKEALNRLLMANNFPEFTGRVCPAPCEGSCVLGIIENPVSIKSIECAIIDKGFENGWIKPMIPIVRTGKKVSIIGSGPAGLAAADQLNKAGHFVTVFEKDDSCGGLLMYGILNMKLDKRIVQRRINLMAQEGVEFITSLEVGVDISLSHIAESSDCVLIAIGSTIPRDLAIPNRDLHGIFFAMDFLSPSTKDLLANRNFKINAKGKRVIVIGGGDTGNDCIGTCVRQGASSVTNFELLPQPPAERADDNMWPSFPKVFKVDYGHHEAKSVYNEDPRKYCVLSKEFISNGEGQVSGIKTVTVSWTRDSKRSWRMEEIPGSGKVYDCDMVLIAMGFVGPQTKLLESMNIETNAKRLIKTVNEKSYRTTVDRIFAAGDCRRGQSLVVWGIEEGRQAAREMDQYLSSGKSALPVSGGLIKNEQRQEGRDTLVGESCKL